MKYIRVFYDFINSASVYVYRFIQKVSLGITLHFHTLVIRTHENLTIYDFSVLRSLSVALGINMI